VSGRPIWPYGSLGDLVASLEEAQTAGRLVHRLKTLTYPSLLIVDEIGYLPITRNGAMLFFQLMSRRYEHAATILTSNKGFEDWGAIFGDDVMAGALIDRLLHHCHIVNIRGNSYRMRDHRDVWQDLNTAEEHPSPPKKRTKPRKEAVTT
jgi:DNA replication protein DnaC